ncbi:hypothetical protein RFI_21462 [Reticulomyxa filosa]|uniref:Uncharacterized protein n=1 Tax=Reticulomyxa filosa TaxID=46433 RepID=X6MQ02_RETFI|nr:hypothetical protein RFI_21462 [Reticulomyxa filosa]|eukprot:ETO15899.1 hypothetical protein RFI_21462 [Reticulomyxa filosa]
MPRKWLHTLISGHVFPRNVVVFQSRKLSQETGYTMERIKVKNPLRREHEQRLKTAMKERRWGNMRYKDCDQPEDELHKQLISTKSIPEIYRIFENRTIPVSATALCVGMKRAVSLNSKSLVDYLINIMYSQNIPRDTHMYNVLFNAISKTYPSKIKSSDLTRQYKLVSADNRKDISKVFDKYLQKMIMEDRINPDRSTLSSILHGFSNSYFDCSDSNTLVQQIDYVEKLWDFFVKDRNVSPHEPCYVELLQFFSNMERSIADTLQTASTAAAASDEKNQKELLCKQLSQKVAKTFMTLTLNTAEALNNGKPTYQTARHIMECSEHIPGLKELMLGHTNKHLNKCILTPAICGVMMSRFGKQGDISKLESIKTMLEFHDIPLNIIHYGILFNAYLKSDCIQKALALWSELLVSIDHQQVPNDRLWNSFAALHIKLLEKQKNRLLHERLPNDKAGYLKSIDNIYNTVMINIPEGRSALSKITKIHPRLAQIQLECSILYDEILTLLFPNAIHESKSVKWFETCLKERYLGLMNEFDTSKKLVFDLHNYSHRGAVFVTRYLFGNCKSALLESCEWNENGDTSPNQENAKTGMLLLCGRGVHRQTSSTDPATSIMLMQTILNEMKSWKTPVIAREWKQDSCCLFVEKSQILNFKSFE